MSNKYERFIVKRTAHFYVDDRLVTEVIDYLKGIAEKYPSAKFKLQGCWDSTYYEIEYEELESDADYDERIAALKLKEESALAKKRAQYEKLKKELGLDDEKT